MQITEEIIKKIADDTGIKDIEELTKTALISLLKDRQMKMKLDILEILDRYGLPSSEALETKIKGGEIPEHPAWEDLITIENIESSLRLIEDDIENLQ